MKTQNPANVISIKNTYGFDITKGSLVKADGSLCNNMEPAIGVCTADTADGEYMPVATSGVVNVKIYDGTSIFAGSSLICGDDGGVALLSPVDVSGLNVRIGKALEPYSAGMTTISMLLTF